MLHNDTNYTLIDTDNLTGTTASQVTPAVKTTYTGYTAHSKVLDGCTNISSCTTEFACDANNIRIASSDNSFSGFSGCENISNCIFTGRFKLYGPDGDNYILSSCTNIENVIDMTEVCESTAAVNCKIMINCLMHSFNNCNGMTNCGKYDDTNEWGSSSYVIGATMTNCYASLDNNNSYRVADTAEGGFNVVA